MRCRLLVAGFFVAAWVPALAAGTTPPPIAKNFLAFCQTHAAECDDHIVAMHISAILYNAQSRTPLGYCYPKTAKTDAGLKAMLLKIKTWMTAQRARYGDKTNDVIHTAYRTLFPCPR